MKIFRLAYMDFWMTDNRQFGIAKRNIPQSERFEICRYCEQNKQWYETGIRFNDLRYTKKICLELAEKEST